LSIAADKLVCSLKDKNFTESKLEEAKIFEFAVNSLSSIRS
jgi:hypothetical protein